MKSKLSLSVCTFVAALFMLACAADAFAGERILVVGDSITGHSLNLEYGYAHEVRNILKDAGSDAEFVPLGGSGQTIFSWRNIIKTSYESNHRLDIQGIMVKDEFDKGADVILVHLGMNDALQPSIKSDEEGFKSWHKEYVSLVNDLRARVPSVKKIILTPPTLLTENPFAFKNVFMDRLGRIIEEVAKETGCEFYDARADFARHFINARTTDPNFRITLDFVHPNKYGHQVMTWSFLTALGYKEIAEKYYNTRVDEILRAPKAPGFCAFVCDVPLAKGDVVKYESPDAAPTVPCEIDGRFFDLDANAIAVESDAVEVKGIEAEDGIFRIALAAKLNALPTEVKVKIGAEERAVKINAPYFVATGFPMPGYPNVEAFPRDKATSPLDAVLTEGANPLAEGVADDGKWFVSYPTADKTGAANPNALDVADLPPANAFDAAYAIRFIVSPKAQKATLRLNSEGFSTTAIETIRLNGKEIYFDCLSPRHKKAKDSVEIELKEGVNILSARIDHTFWQWAASFAVEGAEGLSF